MGKLTPCCLTDGVRVDALGSNRADSRGVDGHEGEHRKHLQGDRLERAKLDGFDRRCSFC